MRLIKLVGLDLIFSFGTTNNCYEFHVFDILSFGTTNNCYEFHVLL